MFSFSFLYHLSKPLPASAPMPSDELIHHTLYSLWQRFPGLIIYSELTSTSTPSQKTRLKLGDGIRLLAEQETSDLILKELNTCFHDVKLSADSSHMKYIKIHDSKEAKKAFDIINQIKLTALTNLFLHYQDEGYQFEIKPIHTNTLSYLSPSSPIGQDPSLEKNNRFSNFEKNAIRNKLCWQLLTNHPEPKSNCIPKLGYKLSLILGSVCTKGDIANPILGACGNDEGDRNHQLVLQALGIVKNTLSQRYANIEEALDLTLPNDLRQLVHGYTRYKPF